ncbi:ROK family protein [Lederbergia galactosidilytica]|uniref:fructokinase n=1 Tax=Lederbergia galactosidilytica TaxID=217031 RepID=A0A177ZWQ9_9BACI|nr:ROK family protein [Lederbergia galactosidilytica]KRG15015.1 fructokinase [Virgibacillus soli]MBP1913387.1 fructokinase [Lederbergia galactosidilytica]OAK72357.1 fructokinase [Lederbergia galactosidilytica]
MLGAIEAGGTKFVCAVGKEDGTLIERIQLDTLTPENTIPHVIEFFKKHEIEALGVGSFGPVDIDKNSATYGNITSTPKPGWKDYPFLQTLKDALHVPMEFNTDVNAAALGEVMLGAAQDVDSCLYITVGTGIGAGAVVQGELLQGLSHPEMGHILVRRHADDQYEGFCPYHGDCLEGMAAGPAIEKRWGKKGVELQDEQRVWELESYYLAQALMQFILIVSPKKIIMGGGVMKQKQLFPLIQGKVQELLNGYVAVPQILGNIDQYIVPPGLGDDAGITGALMLAKRALEN